MSIVQRLEKHSIPVTETGCWLWTGAIGDDGYGRISVGSRSDGTKGAKLAHRVAFQAFVGPIPEGMFVCHRCDTRSCVNPTHLFVGTHQDNMDDMHEKGRHFSGFSTLIGRRNSNARLSDDVVREMRKRYANGVPQPTLAKECGVSLLSVWNAINRRTWKHVS